MPKGIYVRDPASFAPQTIGKPIDETRQHYANVRIAEWRRAHPLALFAEVLSAFRYYGQRYDQGYRLHDRVAA